MSHFELHIISLKYSRDACLDGPSIQYNTPDETEWSCQEAEFYDFFIKRELAKLPPNTKYNLSYWSMKSQNINHFLFAEGYFGNVYLILGKNIMYWQAESGNSEVETLHGVMVHDSGLQGEVGVEEVERILDTIRA